MALAVIGTGIAAGGSPAWAQMGQVAMAPTGGGVNRAVQGFQGLNENGPGILYYGINAADRGLGYQGSYMTLGGFVPGFEDDLGGFWAADLRGHLSTYGGFFSNVGAVRRQFIGGTLLGVGVYWDYDGDQNQYSDTVIPTVGAPVVFAGGHTYNQIGISGEWLTDYGNLRSNGYIPVGTTADLLGPFTGNSILCVNGVNAALGGADLEVGAYIPGLADWAGMISVGGYAYGNTRYQFPNAERAVPWFGGVSTRLDMTFVENWDFSLQANNDSYFDWTGFARLTYRMGGSRRRNVSDQVEQPMMRNEHIVRAHKAPVEAANPATGGAWQVYHVDNTASPGGEGTAERPFATLDAAVVRPANAPYDIVYVHRGSSTATTPYTTPPGGFVFGATHQYLVGEGSALVIPTESCGLLSPFITANNRNVPFVSNPLGIAIVVNEPEVTVDHFGVTNSVVGISDGGSVTGSGLISNVSVDGGGQVRRGIDISASSATFTFRNVSLTHLRDNGLVVSAPNANVVMNDILIKDIEQSAILASGASAVITASNATITRVTGTAAVHASGPGASLSLTSSTLSDVLGTQGNAVVASGSDSAVNITSSRISKTSGAGVVATGPGGAAVTVVKRSLSETRIGAILDGTGNRIELKNSFIHRSSQNGVAVAGIENKLTVLDRSLIDASGLNGLLVEGSSHRIQVNDSRILSSGLHGVSIATTPNAAGPTIATLLRSEIAGVPNGYGMLVEGVNGTGEVIQIFGSSVSRSLLGGLSLTNSNLDVGRDPTSSTGSVTRITSTGPFGIESVATAGETFVQVSDARINGVVDGIRVVSTGAGVVTNFIALENAIGAPVAGSGILFSEEAGSEIKANVQLNRSTLTNRLEITSEEGLVEIRATSRVNLSNINNRALILPEPAGGYIFSSTLVVPPPPTPAP